MSNEAKIKRDSVKSEPPTRRVPAKRALATSAADGGKQRRAKRDDDNDDDVDDKTAVNVASGGAGAGGNDDDGLDGDDFSKVGSKNESKVVDDGGKRDGAAKENAPLPNLDVLGDLGDLLTHPTPDAPIKDLSEKWKLVPAFLKLHGLVRQHIDSFDYFVNVEIKQIIKNNNRVTSDVDPSFFIEYRDVWIGEPCIEEELVVKHITPHQCRLRDVTYAAPIFVSLDYTRGRELVKRNGVQIGRMPIMLRSSKCILSGLSDAALASANECPRDPGGYFVVRGMEKVMLIQEQLSKNRIIIERDFKGVLVASVTSTAHFKSRCQVFLNKHNVLVVRHNNLAEEINCVVMLLGMKVPTSAAVVALVGADLSDALLPTLNDCLALGVRTEHEALDFIGARLRQPQHWRPRRRRDAEAREMLVQVILSQVPTQNFDLRDKAAYFALMMRRILLATNDPTLIDDRDYYGNKRLELAGQLLALLFEDLFKRFNSDLKRSIDKNLEKKHRAEQFDAIKLLRADHITNGLTYALSTGNWSLKRFKMERAGVTAVLSRLSFIASLGMMTRITSQFEKTRKISGPRALQPSQWGLLCPADTPEGESCGLVKNLALLTHVTTGDDEAPLRRACFNLGVEELQRTGFGAMSAQDAFTVLLNGVVLGVHRHPRRFARALRRLRRAGVVGEFVSIHTDERERVVQISADGGRLCRPLLICRGGRPLLTPSHLNAIATGDSNFGDLLLAGVVEFIDVNEENNCLIAVRDREVGPSTTHLEIEPFTLLGVVAGLIPYPNHNQSPRNTYQCAMGKQAMGAIGQNQRVRIDSILYLLVYPQRPLCQTRTIELIGYNELPAGQNASIAVMSFSGYDIEDALVLNKASLDRGFGRCALLRKQLVSAKKYANMTRERFEFPAASMSAPAKLHALDRDGIALPGSRISPGDIFVNRKVPEDTTGSIKSDPALVPTRDVESTHRSTRSIIVDQVVLTSSEDDHSLVKLLFRDTRRPELGDKFSSRHGQKGVVGLIANATDVPFAGNGVCPDIIMNPHGFPSRMTVGKMIELIAGKAGALTGKFRYGTAFGGCRVTDIGSDLINAGYSYSGKDCLTCGITGESLPSYVFAGPVYYQKLKHMVVDKMHARARGPRAVLTRQPTEGRSRDGGLRLGEMERDCLIAYGSSLLLLERLMISSDMFDVYVCKSCGFMGFKGWCQHCKSPVNVVTFRIPYGCKLLFQELTSMGVTPKLKLENV